MQALCQGDSEAYCCRRYRSLSSESHESYEESESVELICEMSCNRLL